MYRKSITTIKLEEKRKRALAMRATKKRIRSVFSDDKIIVGTLRTNGVLGEHTIKVLQGQDESKTLYLMVDDKVTDTRTLRGIRHLLTELLSPYGVKFEAN